MAEYISALTGSQMDAALLDMAEHNSEAWAVGQRSGFDVGSDDETHNNNAKYYAEQAARVVPTTGTPAVRYDTAQVLTETEQATARNNIGAERTGIASNPNLLDNWWFGKGVVNQRGQTTYSLTGTAKTYFIDRFCERNASCTITLEDDGITITNTSSSYNAFIEQYLENPTDGSAVTASLDVVSYSGTSYVQLVTPSAEFGSAVMIDRTGIVSFTDTRGLPINRFFLQVNKGASIKIKAVKLELGSVSTLANDNAPDYATELLKCQRYYYRLTASNSANNLYEYIGMGVAYDVARLIFLFPLPVEMRSACTTVTFSSLNDFKILGGNNSKTPTSIVREDNGKRTARLNINCDNSYTVGATYVMRFNGVNGAYIDFSADL